MPGQAATPSTVASDGNGLPPAAIQEKPPVILLPSVSTTPAAAGRPMEKEKPVVALPPDIDPDRVTVVKHDAKKVDGEMFRYTDKPLKPLGASDKKPELIKYTDKKAGSAIKSGASPATAPARPNDHERRGPEIFKYSPSRVEIKN